MRSPFLLLPLLLACGADLSAELTPQACARAARLETVELIGVHPASATATRLRLERRMPSQATLDAPGMRIQLSEDWRVARAHLTATDPVLPPWFVDAEDGEGSVRFAQGALGATVEVEVILRFPDRGQPLTTVRLSGGSVPVEVCDPAS
jgi:hypothetical protein